MDALELKTMVDSDYSQREMADKLNLSQSTVRYWLKKYNLKTKKEQFNRGNSTISAEGKKFCSQCGQTKDITDFYKRSGRKDGAGYCKNCSNKYHTERVKRVKIKMINYKGGKCNDCGLELIHSHYAVFDFHHLDPKTKDINFNRIKYQKWETIQKEIDKCVLLCSNCHRIRHAEDSNK
jgi:transposase